ncbi:MAG: S-methyl-5-thioribose-1-phosphate isomerase [Spirochaetia bacterium]|nr:S-methyl-5-thioribose-1-phosphate isomerase [Spirochaetia bacterium]
MVPLKIQKDKLYVLDQRILPHEIFWLECKNENETAAAIKDMYVRGAPAIGIAAAYGFYLGVYSLVQNGKKVTDASLNKIKNTLDKSRPTAVNLFWATEKMYSKAVNFLKYISKKNAEKEKDKSLLNELYNEALSIHEDDAKRCYDMSVTGLDYIKNTIKKKKYRILTHCNAGSLATGGIGTALGVIRLLHNEGKVENVYCDETRPYLQGARLTAFEFQKEKIPATLITDSMAGFLMQKGLIDLIVTGADRITRRHDVANKIGTYSLSVLAKAHKIPFFVAAPLSTFDENLISGSEIPIEERSADEVRMCQGKLIAAKIPVLNYSFDVTPKENITAIFHEEGVVR